jgi:UDPglucose--hexose-1-phosphate uridylyltransferase
MGTGIGGRGLSRLADFASLLPNVPVVVEDRHPLLRAEAGPGTYRVICFSPRHDLSLGTLGAPGILGVVDVWAGEVAELTRSYECVQVFENRGAAMGASNPHPHGQIWAGSAVPTQILLEDTQQRQHPTSVEGSLLVEYVGLEMKDGRRLVVDNRMVGGGPILGSLAIRDSADSQTACGASSRSLGCAEADAGHGIEELLARYDNLFNMSFPYSMGWHGAPGTQPAPQWQLHAHFYPPLLGGNRRKFMVGYELLAEPQRDLTPEEAAERLRATRSGRYPSMSL